MWIRLIRISVVLVLALQSSALAQSVAEAPDCIYDNDQTYRIEVPTEVHTGPSNTRRTIYDLPANAGAIRCVGPCRDEWCRVRWHGVVGWVERRHLIPSGHASSAAKP